MFVVTVDFRILPAFRDQFVQAVYAQARNSLTLEDDCLQFDVCTRCEEPDRVFLYEVYASEEAFRAHLASTHFAAFSSVVEAWVVTKALNTWSKHNA
jgi:quinol monooxygenase YgiN